MRKDRSMKKIDTNKAIRHIKENVKDISDKDTVLAYAILNAINDQLEEHDTNQNDLLFCIYNKHDERMYQYGTGDWTRMNRIMRNVEKNYPDAGFYVGETDD
jgi:hypothetical protein